MLTANLTVLSRFINAGVSPLARRSRRLPSRPECTRARTLLRLAARKAGKHLPVAAPESHGPYTLTAGVRLVRAVGKARAAAVLSGPFAPPTGRELARRVAAIKAAERTTIIARVAELAPHGADLIDRIRARKIARNEARRATRTAARNPNVWA